MLILLFSDEEHGFHVSVTSSYTIQPSQTLRFDNVVTNIGGFFDTDKNRFISPLAGTYMFSISIACDRGNVMHVSLVKNDEHMFTALCYNESEISRSQGGGLALLTLNAFDEVKLKMIWPTRKPSHVYGHGTTSFSGYLLRQY